MGLSTSVIEPLDYSDKVAAACRDTGNPRTRTTGTRGATQLPQEDAMTEAFIFDAVRTPRGKGKKDGALHSVKPVNLIAGLLSSCKQTLNTTTENEQVAVLPDESATVHVTVVVPVGNAPPDGGVQMTAPSPGQLSLAVGVG